MEYYVQWYPATKDIRQRSILRKWSSSQIELLARSRGGWTFWVVSWWRTIRTPCWSQAVLCVAIQFFLYLSQIHTFVFLLYPMWIQIQKKVDYFCCYSTYVYGIVIIYYWPSACFAFQWKCMGHLAKNIHTTFRRIIKLIDFRFVKIIE